MAFWLPAMALGGAAMGAMKNQRARQIEDSDRKLAAETARYSPWTGMAPQQIRRAGSAFGDILQGGIGGAMTGMQFQNMANAPQTAEQMAGPEMAYAGNYTNMPQKPFNPWDLEGGMGMGQRIG